MKVIALALATLVASAAVAQAQGWNRQSSTTGPNGGVWSSSGSGSCQGGACASNQRSTGPAGRTVTRSGSASCSGGTCKGSATYTGPAGRTVTRNRSLTVN